MDPLMFSSLGRLLRVTNNVFKFINNIIRRKGWRQHMITTTPTQFWITKVQSEKFPIEVCTLKSLSGSRTNVIQFPEPAKKSLRHNKLINNLGLYLDDGQLIRCKGRLHHSTLQYGAKHPILLPKNHWFTQVVIRDCHHNTLHRGVADTLNNIRQTFWIPQARQVIKTFIRKCIRCRRYDARKIRYPEPPPLPSESITESKPFQTVGVDYTGAIYLRNPSGEDGSEPTKVYIYLFTCATTSAVHLELATDMSADTFLRAFRRFIARRSCPKLVISDNGTNFRASGKFLKEYFELQDVK